MATRTLLHRPATAGELDAELLARHFDRKHGPARLLRPADPRRERRPMNGTADRHRLRHGVRARAVLVDVATGAELATAVHAYANGVIDRRLPAPDDDVVLEPGLGAPGPGRLRRDGRRDGARGSSPTTGIDPADVIGIGIDFTSCTMLPDHRRRHAAVPGRRSCAASRTPGSSSGSTTPRSPRRTGSTRWPPTRGEAWLPRYGGRISSEWFIAKSLQILDEAPARLPRRPTG